MSAALRALYEGGSVQTQSDYERSKKEKKKKKKKKSKKEKKEASKQHNLVIKDEVSDSKWC